MQKDIYLENIRIAFKSVKSQLLKTIITASIIAIGISCLVGMLTAVDAMKGSLNGQFALLGANTFSLQNRGPNITIGKRGKKQKAYPAISYKQAQDFKTKFRGKSGIVSVSYIATGMAQASYKSEKTNPNIAVWAADENYLETGGYELESGRDISESDVINGSPVALIGQEIKSSLFPKKDPLGEVFEIGGKRFRIIGVLAPKGNTMGFGGDKSIFIPISRARSQFSRSNQSFALNVMALGPDMMDPLISEATAEMRKIRHLNPIEENDFSITKSDSLSQTLIESLGFVQLAALLIAGITLFSAAIALMNIMLVSVTERTKEIGIRKAVGAKAKTIRLQFLTEATFICILGGIGGIIFGLGLGNLIPVIIGGTFVMPWDWMLLSIVICIFVGLLSGLYPAYKASKLDPIDALRYE